MHDTNRQEMIKNVLQEVNEAIGIDSDVFITDVLSEVNIHLIESGIHGHLRQIALEKMRHDLRININNNKGKLKGLKPSRKLQAVKPIYFDAFMDEELAEDVIYVHIDRFVKGVDDIPEKLAKYLGNAMFKAEPKWAELNLDPTIPEKNMIGNTSLFEAVLMKLGVL